MENVKRAIKPHGHFMKNRRAEIALGVLLFMIGALLVYDAFDGRGKSLPWPLGAVAPWLGDYMSAMRDVRERLDKLEARFQWLDEHGSRAVTALTLQVTELAKDIGALQTTIESTQQSIERASANRWSQSLQLLTVVLPLYGLVIALLVSHL